MKQHQLRSLKIRPTFCTDHIYDEYSMNYPTLFTQIPIENYVHFHLCINDRTFRFGKQKEGNGMEIVKNEKKEGHFGNKYKYIGGTYFFILLGNVHIEDINFKIYKKLTLFIL